MNISCRSQRFCALTLAGLFGLSQVSFVHAAWPVVPPTTYTSTDTLEASNWNNMVQTVQEAKIRLENNIYSDGDQVGIGTFDPSDGLKLDIEGKVGARLYCDEDGVNCFDAVDVYSATSSGNESHWQKNQDALNYADGFVGIGVATLPQAKLHVADGQILISDSAPALSLQETDTIDANYQVTVNNGFKVNKLSDEDVWLANPLRVEVAAPTNALVIGQDGVGVGTANINAKLDVAGKIKSSSTAVTDDGNIVTTKDYVDAQLDAQFQVVSALGGSDDLGNHMATQSINAGGFPITNVAAPVNENDAVNKEYVGQIFDDAAAAFWSHDDAGSIYRDSGRVGIGTEDPEAKLDVNGDVQISGNIHTGDGVNGFNLYTRSEAGYDLFQIGARTSGVDESLKVITLRRDSGNVGIGTSSPSGDLHIQASTGAGTNNPGTAAVIVGPIDSAHIEIDDNEIAALANSTSMSDLHLQADGGNVVFHERTAEEDKVIISESGQVGIGTTSPKAKLDVRDYSFIFGAPTGDHNGDGVEDFENGALVSSYDDETGSPYLNFIEYDNPVVIRGRQTIHDDTKDALISMYDGNVGIGTTDPSVTLDVEGQVGATEYCDQDGDNCFSPSVMSGVEPGETLVTGSGAEHQVAKFDSEGGIVDSQIFDDGNNVGVGTNTPGTEASGDPTAMSGGLSINGTGDTQLTVQKNGVSGFAVNVGETTTGDAALYDKVGGTWNRAIVLNSGNVGVGTNSPTAKLDVDGDINFTGDLYQGGTLFENGKFKDGTTATDAVYTNGKVGIGTTSPSSTLHVDGGTADTSVATGTPIAQFARGAEGRNFIAFYADGGGNYIVADDPGANQKNLHLQTRNNKDIILSPHGTGNVGIGTTNPSSKLHISTSHSDGVYQGFENNATYTTTTDDTNYTRAESTFANKVVNAGVTDSGYLIGSWTRTMRNMTTSDADDSGTLDRLFGQVIHYGNYNKNSGESPVINTATGLNVVKYNWTGSINTSYGVKISTASGSAAVANDFGIYQDSTVSKNYFAGNVGIGTANPTAKLEVAGDMILGGDGGSGRLLIGGTYSTGQDDKGPNSHGFKLVHVGENANNHLRIGTDTGQIGDAAIEIYQNYAGGNEQEPGKVVVNGEVGIGTASPSSKLHVSGDGSNGITVSGDEGYSIQIIGNQESHSVITNAHTGSIIGPKYRSLAFELNNNDNNDRFSFITDPSNGATADTEAMVITGAGNVGIGTTNPSSKLDIFTSHSDGDYRGFSNNAIYTTTTDDENRTPAESTFAHKVVNAGVTDSGYLIGSWIHAMRNMSTSDADDSGTLDKLFGQVINYGNYDKNSGESPVINTATGLNVVKYNRTGSINTSYGVKISTALGSAAAANDFGIYQNSTASKNYFAGNVGIGTTSPSSTLHVDGGTADNSVATGTPIAQFARGAGGGNFIAFYADAFANYIVADDSGTNQKPLHLQTRNNNDIILNPHGTGNVGIGTTAPDYKLHVVGTAAKNGGGSWTNSSDARLKDVHGGYSLGLDEISQLETITFSYKPDNARGLPSDTTEIGFVAQEVQKIFPQAVSEGSDGYLDFNMHAINVALVNAVKELKTITTEQQAMIEDLQSQLAER